eukprot:GHVU01185658.1.p1 GENE.GHVU01185658.1~~GHVU01185658.1.p1  ORF type:complete len:161 (+),score=0.78 GHVU01185658.1:281-763(+)
MRQGPSPYDPALGCSLIPTSIIGLPWPMGGEQSSGISRRRKTEGEVEVSPDLVVRYRHPTDLFNRGTPLLVGVQAAPCWWVRGRLVLLVASNDYRQRIGTPDSGVRGPGSGVRDESKKRTALPVGSAPTAAGLSDEPTNYGGGGRQQELGRDSSRSSLHN